VALNSAAPIESIGDDNYLKMPLAFLSTRMTGM
jgi:hypothetical protein